MRWTRKGDPAYRIQRLGRTGDAPLLIETRRPPVAVSKAERDSVIADVAEELRKHGVTLNSMRIPEIKPAVESMFVSDEGKLWVSISSPDTLYRYDVYEENGRYVGTAATGLKVYRWVKAIMRGDQVWAVVLGDLDVPHVIRAGICAG